MDLKKLSLLLLISSLQLVSNAQIGVLDKSVPGTFPLVSNGKAAIIKSDDTDAEVVRIAIAAFRNDIKLVTGITSNANVLNTSSPQVIVGTIGKSKLIDQLIANKKLSVNAIKGKWETFSITQINNPFQNTKQILVIAGSDPRGTAFGVFELSKLIGVSPFYWWADVNPKSQKELYLSGNLISKPPSVKYRGIFLNDEDWGLQPWAAKTFEPETGDIGPKTYTKIFELLLRLKANLIWPAMHPSTKAFYHYLGNKKVAADYAIVVGSSHAEPMLRNNVGEWDKSMGDFNYITNKEKIYNYWESRVKESKGNDAIYTMGMRGVHDSGMEGVKSVDEAIPLLEKIIEEQRDMLRKHVNSNIGVIPQVFTVYKEVLDIYDRNIKLADDITVVWPDDNYGYIQRLNSEKENKRSGGSGVYYHASYWGRPHDYLWLSSTHPGLIREEMMKAYETRSNRLWVLNVGDIKPLEYNIQLFMDMAYQAEPFKESSYTKTHLKNWAGNIFGADKAEKITSILWKYYQLAFERRPEFMGWSQTEPTTQTNYSEYNHFRYGDEAQQRIDEYEKLVASVSALRTQINSKDADAFYQLVYYPVVGASLMTKKFLYRDKAYLYSSQNRTSSKDFAAMSQQAYDDIIKETEYYNNQLANGKWKYMMSMEPRGLPVYKKPDLPKISIDKSKGIWDVLPEGSSVIWEGGHSLPVFNRTSNKKYFVDVFIREDRILNWTAVYENWIILSQRSGSLKPEAGKRQNRIWVSIDWSKVPSTNRKNGKIFFKSGDQTIEVNVGANNNGSQLAAYKGYIEDNRLIAINASNFSRKTEKGNQKWTVINGLGITDKVVEALPLQGGRNPNLETLKENAAYLE